MNKLTKLEKYWVLYDVGNSAFVLLVSTIIPIYFKNLAKNTIQPTGIERAAKPNTPIIIKNVKIGLRTPLRFYAG